MNRLSRHARCALVTLLATALPASAEPGGRPGWTDVHSHLVAKSAADVPAAVAGALSSMRRNAIGRIYLMPPPQISRMPQLVTAEHLAAAAAQHPDRIGFLGGGGCLNRMLHDAGASERVTESARRAFEARAQELLGLGASGFGEIATLHISHEPRHAYEWTPADHPLLLLLADIAARAGVPIDLHQDLVTADMPTPARWSGNQNPSVLRENRRALERLLAHNRAAKIVWAHAGSDPLGNQTPELCREMLSRHTNLYISLRVGPSARPECTPIEQDGSVKPDWLALFQAYPDRFVLGIDQFIPGGEVRGGPLADMVKRGERVCANARTLLRGLPPPLARRLAFANAQAIYGRR